MDRESVIPGLTRNPVVLLWIPLAFAGMTWISFCFGVTDYYRAFVLPLAAGFAGAACSNQISVST